MFSFKATVLGAATLLAATTSVSAAGVYVLVNCLGGGGSSEIWYYPNKNDFTNYVVPNDAKTKLTSGSLFTWEGRSMYYHDPKTNYVIQPRINGNGHMVGAWTGAGQLDVGYQSNTAEHFDTHPCYRADDYMYPATAQWQCYRVYACYE